MPELKLPRNFNPRAIVGQTKVLAGQRWLFPEVVIDYAQKMLDDRFNWDEWQNEQPMAVQVLPRGLMIDQGHHRWVAAKLVNLPVPVDIEVRYDWWPQDAPFAVTWDEVEWER